MVIFLGTKWSIIICFKLHTKNNWVYKQQVDLQAQISQSKKKPRKNAKIQLQQRK